MRVRYDVVDGKQIENLYEVVCFRIDKNFDSRHALVLLATLQSYIKDCKAKTESWNIIHRQHRKYMLCLAIACENTAMLRFLTYWLKQEDIYKLEFRLNLAHFKIQDFDYYVDVTMDKILDLTREGMLHFHQGMGILLGCASESLADISIGTEVFESGTIVVAANCLDIISNGSFEYLFGDKYKEIIVVSLEEENSMSLDLLGSIQKAEAIIGKRGFITYAASCYKRPVLELIDSTEDFWLLTTWSNPYYAPVLLDEAFDPKRGVGRLWYNVLAYRSSLTSSQQTQEALHE